MKKNGSRDHSNYTMGKTDIVISSIALRWCIWEVFGPSPTVLEQKFELLTLNAGLNILMSHLPIHTGSQSCMQIIKTYVNHE